MASFFNEISANRSKSVLMLLVFFMLFMGIVYLFSFYFGLGAFGLVIGAALILLYAAFVYYAGDKVVLKMSNAKPADRSAYSTFYSAAEGLSAATQVPMPSLYVINDPSPNAFATGRGKKHASIAATTGLLQMMDRSELEGVISHEMSHIANNDILFMMVAVVFAGAIGILAALIRNVFYFGSFGERGRQNGGFIILIAFVISLLAPLFALLLRLAISRRREYMADANGARITRDPSSLVSALTKISAYSGAPNSKQVKHANELTASMYFANPFTTKSLSNIFSTHPPIDERIKRLKGMY